MTTTFNDSEDPGFGVQTWIEPDDDEEYDPEDQPDPDDEEGA